MSLVLSSKAFSGEGSKSVNSGVITNNEQRLNDLSPMIHSGQMGSDIYTENEAGVATRVFDANNADNIAGCNGICQSCHPIEQSTKAGSHFSTTSCLQCHKHNPSDGLAFVPNGACVACDTCHGYPPAPRNLAVFNVRGAWVDAKLENYSGGGGAHLVAAHLSKDLILTGTDDDWIPCLPCHYGGKKSHLRALPLRNNVENISVEVDPQYRFSNDRFIVYTSSKLVSGGGNRSGSCYNVNCHFKSSPKWSTVR